MSALRTRHRRTAIALSTIIVAMLALTAASVPLYRLFCQVTGYGGTTQRAEAAPEQAVGDPIAVSFNADVAPGLPWSFQPVQRRIEVRPGEEHLIFYEAVNHDGGPVVGTAVFNVTPFKVGAYFNKIQCFCFDEQTLDPGQRVDMGVSFFIDPAILDDPDARDVAEITLSYTFYIDEKATAELRKRRAGPMS
ncbi:MAG TPA: cytochrome c oxidase assembly protein [Geminicoccaceae bacterium]|nr:cytochrome c oxidase assembly protein [Geminicoccus sp.]HMU49587.1 cytochrome c oxidase assembly protein [Geminicoccaceae bacterium]